MKERKSSKVTQLRNEYTKTKTVQAHRENKFRKQRKRRIASIAVISGLFITGLSVNLVKNTQLISDLDAQKVAAAEELEQVEATQENLQNEVKKLQDDEYIAKLARSQYYLSKEGEIVFSFPEDNAAKTQKEETQEESDSAKSDEKEETADEN